MKRSPRPRQAVLLADGGAPPGRLRGRDAPVMVDIGGRPFIAYIVDLLRQEGFTDVLVLVGGLADPVRRYFGSGADAGVRITYSVSTAPVTPAEQVRVASAAMDEQFLLLHADTYWPMRFDGMWRDYGACGVPAMTAVYDNTDGYARDNVTVSGGRVELFDATGRSPALRGCDIGYAILRRDSLDLMSPAEESFEGALYPALAHQRALAVCSTSHRFYSVTTPECLALTRSFLARKPAVILDRDGVLNRRPAAGEYVRSAAEFEWLPGALDALRAFRAAGYTVIVASNHAGLARGQVTVEALESIHDLMRSQARAAGGGIDAIYQCPHEWYAGCDCRKPRPGLLFQAQRDFSLDLTRTSVIGDDQKAMRAAEAAGAVGRLVTADMPLIAHAQDILWHSATT